MKQHGWHAATAHAFVANAKGVPVDQLTACILDRPRHSEIIEAVRKVGAGIRLIPDGEFARLIGRDTIRVNSLHGQGILEPGARVVVEGVAEDGTIEAIRIADAPGFALGVQWHAEYDPQRNPINRALFEAFGNAVAAHSRTRA